MIYHLTVSNWKNESKIFSQFSNRIFDSPSFSCGWYQAVTNWPTCGSTSPNVTDTSSLNPHVQQTQPLYVTLFIPPFSLLSYLTSPYFQFVEQMLKQQKPAVEFKKLTKLHFHTRYKVQIDHTEGKFRYNACNGLIGHLRSKGTFS